MRPRGKRGWPAVDGQYQPLPPASAARANTGPRTTPSAPQAMALAMSAERSEEHTSELQSRGHLVCRLLLEKKNNHIGSQVNNQANELNSINGDNSTLEV